MLRKKFKENKIIYFCFIDYTKGFDYVHNKLWKIKEVGKPDHLICLLRSLYAGQEATVKTGHGTMEWFKTGKGVHQGCIFLPWQFNLNTEYIMWRGFPGGSVVKKPTCQCRSCGSNHQCGKVPWRRKQQPIPVFLQLFPYSTLTSLMVQMVKNLPTMQEVWTWSLDWEDPLKKGKAIHSIILVWRIPWIKEPGRL